LFVCKSKQDYKNRHYNNGTKAKLIATIKVIQTRDNNGTKAKEIKDNNSTKAKQTNKG
jgi:hypothetical protein